MISSPFTTVDGKQILYFNTIYIILINVNCSQSHKGGYNPPTMPKYTNGNITEQNEFDFATGELLNTKTWEYNDSTWSDLLTNCNGTTITYDEIGNPLTVGNKELSWTGRQLQSITDGDSEISYTYNGDGLRTSKTVNGETTEYYYNGSILAGQKSGDNTLVFMYDNNSDIFGFIYNDTEYYYIKNAQNDVIAIADADGNVIVNYEYDTWGKVTAISGNTSIANLNPILYRSYYYDKETEWYYLTSRFYNPEFCRFVNSDNYALPTATPTELTDKNLFAYCDNNPITRVDDDGNLWTYAGLIAVSALVGGTICAAISATLQYAETGDIDWAVVGINFISGAISGGVAMTGIGLLGSVAVNAALGGGTYIAEQLVKGEEITCVDTVVSTAAGAFAGLIGGKGANGKNIVYNWNNATKGIAREMRRANIKYATKQTGKYILRKNGIKKGLRYISNRFAIGSFINARRFKSIRRRGETK